MEMRKIFLIIIKLIALIAVLLVIALGYICLLIDRHRHGRIGLLEWKCRRFRHQDWEKEIVCRRTKCLVTS